MKNSFTQNKWKPIVIGLAAVLAVVLTTPQAYAASPSLQLLQQAVTALQTQVTNLQNAITSETSARTSADTSLQSQIDSAVGDITGVIVGQGLAGGASSGDATVSLQNCPEGDTLESTGSGWQCSSAP